MKILFVYSKNVRKNLNEYYKGNLPATFLYGLPLLLRSNPNIDFYQSYEGKIFNLLKRWMTKLFGYTGGGIIHLCKIPFSIYKYDVVFMVHYDVVYPLILLKILLFPSKKLIFLNDRAEKFIKPENKIKRFLLSKCDLIISGSKYQYEKSKALFRSSKTVYLYWGGDRTFFNRDESIKEEEFILSVGADPARDYHTLFKAASCLPYLKFVVIGKIGVCKDMEIPENVRLLYNVSPLELKEFYNKAKIIIIPLYSDTHPIGSMTSGRSVLGDCICIGKPVIISKRAWVSEYLADGVDAQFTETEDVESLVKNIELLLNNPEYRKKLAVNIKRLSSIFNTDRFAKELEKIIYEA